MMKNRQAVLLLTVICLIAVSRVYASSNILQNPGFEMGDFSNWDHEGSGFVSAGDGQGTNNGWYSVEAHSGTQLVVWNTDGLSGSISQSFDTISSGSISFWWTAVIYGSPNWTIDLKVRDATTLEWNKVGGVNPRYGYKPWTEYTYEITYPISGVQVYGNLPQDWDPSFMCIDDVSVIPEPSTLPVADAEGPYTIYVGDTLTLDANGSTNADDDIVSYMWDLDDNNSFETDAGGQAIFDVNYTYLQSLGLIVDHTYNIHVQVTDSEGQSDVANSTLTIVPKPALAVAVDIKPGSCPNPVNVKSSGVLPIAILGTDDYDITTIDPTSIRLAGVEPLRSGYEDVATPVSDSNDCNCTTDGPDGFLDLTLKFETQKIVEAIGDVNDGDVRVLTLTGVLFDPIPFETPIEGADCIVIRGRHKPINPADINKDGVVNAADFAIFAQNWLQSSIVEE